MTIWRLWTALSDIFESGNLHLSPNGHELSMRVRKVGGGSPLEGVEALGLSASLWGEQVISYVASGERANPGRIPGVSRADSA